MDCDCNHYAILELQRQDISRRIKESKILKKKLRSIGKQIDGGEKLYQCETCNQRWQGSYAWNFGNGEYLFKVPFVEIGEWDKKKFVAPDNILIYLILVDKFINENNFESSNEVCRKEDCNHQSLKGNNYCLKHHLISLQSIGNLPKKPEGVFFEPYKSIYNKYQNLFDETIAKFCG